MKSDKESTKSALTKEQKMFRKLRFLMTEVKMAEVSHDKDGGIAYFIMILKAVPFCWHKTRKRILARLETYRSS